MPVLSRKFKRTVHPALVMLLLIVTSHSSGNPQTKEKFVDTGKSTVKIICTFVLNDYCSPWKVKSHSTKAGSGAVITGKRILTNAHVVSDATFIQVQMENSPVLYNASVLHVSHEADVAVIKVDDENFFKGTIPLELGGLPKLRTSVTISGYPVGGERIAITEGVISRIEIGKYSHDGDASFLMIQTDAAINPGNSGGPAIQNGKIVGLAFQVRTKTSNIGYLIPASVINHFLTDVEDGVYDGFPSLGIMTEKLLNRSYREFLGMGETRTGVVITSVIRGGSAEKYLNEKDVLLSIDGYPIANDGSISFPDGRIGMSHLIYLKQKGEKIELVILRNQKEMTLIFPVKQQFSRINWSNEYGRKPRYIIFSGLVFQVLSNEYLKCWDKTYDTSDLTILYAFYFHNTDMIDLGRKEFIVINQVLPDTSNSYLADIHDRIVNEINGIPINSLDDILKSVQKPSGDFHLIKLEGVNKPVVINAKGVDEADKRIMKNYKIPALSRLK